MKNVSVIMPAYNAGNFIEESILSIVHQSYRYWTLFIVNDGSKDNTKEVILKYLNLYPQKIKFINKIENEGTVRGLNTLIGAADGDYVCWLSADDLYTKDMLKESVEYLNKHKDIDVVFSDYETIDENSNFLRASPYNRCIEELKMKNKYQPYQQLLTIGNCIHGCTVMLKRTCFDDVGMFNKKYRYAHDYDMWIRIAARYRIGYLDAVHVRGREYSSQISMQGNNEVDAIKVLFDFVECSDFKKLYYKAGFKDLSEALRAVIIGQLKTYKSKKKEFDELQKVLLEAPTKSIQCFWKQKENESLYKSVLWIRDRKWNLSEKFFEDDSQDSYLKILCNMVNIDAICINKQAIRFDRFKGNTADRFHNGLIRSNDIVIGTTTLNKLLKFLHTHGEEYRSFIINQNNEKIKIGITYYMYLMSEVVKELQIQEVQHTSKDIWWELMKYSENK